jgi:hypothetical protein
MNYPLKGEEDSSGYQYLWDRSTIYESAKKGDLIAAFELHTAEADAIKSSMR